MDGPIETGERYSHADVRDVSPTEREHEHAEAERWEVTRAARDAAWETLQAMQTAARTGRPGWGYSGGDPGLALFTACLAAGAPMPITPGMRVLEVGCCEGD